MIDKRRGIDREGRGSLLEERRKSLGMSLDDMAARTGLSRTKLYRQETDAAHLPEPNDAAVICKAYGVTMVELVQAAGYELGLGDIKRTVADAMTFAEFLNLKFNIENPDDFAPGLEKLLRGAANQSDAESKGRG